MNQQFKDNSKRIITLIIILILLITINTSADFNYEYQTKNEDSNNYFREHKDSFYCIPIKGDVMNNSNNPMYDQIQIDPDLPFNGPGDQITPEILQFKSDITLVAYYDEIIDNVTLSISIDNGETWSNPFPFYDNYTYPSLDIWNKNRIFGTAVTHPKISNGGIIGFIDFVNITNPTTWILYSYDFSIIGWYGMKDASIACDNNGNHWEWGVTAYIISTTFEEGYIDGPSILYADPEQEVPGWMGWSNTVENCAHCDIDIDPILHLSYAIYDYFNTSSEKWELFILQTDFKDQNNRDRWREYMFDEDGNLQCPVVSAYNDTLVILAEYEENGNKDIICLYSSIDILDEEINKMFIANSTEGEYCPNLIHVENQTFICSFIKNGNIFTTWTMDGGAHWTPPFQVNENEGKVVDTYKSSSLCFPFLIWEEQHQDIDLFLEKFTMPPATPTIQGRNSGTIGTSYELTITATHPDELNLSYFIDWGDGTNESWTDLTSSGKSLTLNHIYDSEGIYDIRGKARNNEGVESFWAFHQVTIPKYKSHFNLFIRFLENHPRLFPILRLLLI
jgi:hypothetical protein